MTKNDVEIASLAMDLKRVAVGYHSGSSKMALRFREEALRRVENINTKNIQPYIAKFINSIPQVFDQKDKGKVAEDSLMYSTLLQNYVLSKE